MFLWFESQIQEVLSPQVAIGKRRSEEEKTALLEII